MVSRTGSAPEKPMQIYTCHRTGPNFAAAYSYLGPLYGNLGETSLEIEYIREAYTLRNHLTALEKYIISGLYYTHVTGELPKAVEQYQLLVNEYPHYYWGHHNLGDLETTRGMFDQAAAEFRQSLQLEPDNYHSWSELGWAYAVLGRLDEAQAVLDEGVSRKIDAPPLHSTLYFVAFLKGDEAAMRHQVNWAIGKTEAESDALATEADTQGYRGRMAKARELSRAARSAALRDDTKEMAALVEAAAAIREAEVGNSVTARQGVKAALAIFNGRDVRSVSALALAAAGDSKGAAKLADGLQTEFPLDTLIHNYSLPAVRARIELNNRHPQRALDLLRASVPYDLGNAGPMVPVYVRGQAYLASGNGPAATAEFQKLLDHRGLVFNDVTGTLSHLYLGRALTLEPKTLPSPEADRARAQARAAYRDFFTLWNDADHNIPILAAAKVEYSRLE